MIHYPGPQALLRRKNRGNATCYHAFIINDIWVCKSACTSVIQVFMPAYSPQSCGGAGADEDTPSAAGAAGRQARARPSLCGYDPYDPYRPVRRKRPRSPPAHHHKSRSRSLFNLEWKILKVGRQTNVIVCMEVLKDEIYCSGIVRYDVLLINM